MTFGTLIKKIVMTLKSMHAHIPLTEASLCGVSGDFVSKLHLPEVIRPASDQKNKNLKY
jgi:hypothetical protein